MSLGRRAAALLVAGVVGAATAPASAAGGLTVPTLRGVPAFINRSLQAVGAASAYRTTDTMVLDMGMVKEKMLTEGSWLRHGAAIRNYEVTTATITSQGTSRTFVTYSYMDATQLCTRTSTTSWKCVPNPAKSMLAKFLPFVSVVHAKTLAPKVIHGQRALGAVLTIDLNLAGAAAAAGAPGPVTSAIGHNAVITATYWVSAQTYLPIAITVSGFGSAPTTVTYAAWNSPAVTIPPVP